MVKVPLLQIAKYWTNNLAIWGKFYKTLWIRKLWICSNGQILTVNLLINCKNSVNYSKMAINYEEIFLWNRPLVCLTFNEKQIGTMSKAFYLKRRQVVTKFHFQSKRESVKCFYVLRGIFNLPTDVRCSVTRLGN